MSFCMLVLYFEMITGLDIDIWRICVQLVVFLGVSTKEQQLKNRLFNKFNDPNGKIV